jgi:hypothetical protein
MSQVLRRLFAIFKVSECYRDFSSTLRAGCEVRLILG